MGARTGLTLLGSAFILWSAYTHLYHPACLRCQMSFMSPYYTQIYLNSSSSLPYKLYRYDDAGEYDKAELGCVPVLFLPGNRGSHKQARSIGTLLASPEFREGTCFKVYTIDYLDEASALSADTLNAQAAWARTAVARVRSLHRNVKSIALIGHSMGGILTRMLAVGEEVPQDDILIVTLASPHSRPPINADPEIKGTLYPALHQAVKQPLIVSIGGGSADLQVLQDMVVFDEELTIDTEHLRYSWCSPDHRAIVWEASLTRFIGDLLTKAFHSNTLLPTGRLRESLVAFITNSQQQL